MNARAALTILGTLTLLGAAAPRGSAGAQLTAADVALASGRLPRAESLYYLQASRRPRDPLSRAALGRYLAARGALRVGAVLLEEARMFGGDPGVIARDLASLYRELGDWNALARLPASPLSLPQREQARWLVSHPGTLAMPESVTVAYRAPRDTGSLGEVTIRAGGRTLTATIDARRVGLVLDDALRSAEGVTLFEPRGVGDGVPAVVTELRIGDLALGHVAATIAPLGGATRAVIGLDLLRALAPRFDAPAGRLVLHRSGRVRRGAAGKRYPMLSEDDGVRVLLDGRFLRLGGRAMRERLLTRRWMLDARRGEFVLY